MAEIRWKTHDGKQLFIHEMTHEHISSLYHFTKYVSTRYQPEVVEEIDRVIKEQYDGIILPYRPPCTVVGEIELLFKKGMLKYDKEAHKYNIINEDNEWIGEIILTPDLEVDENTGLLKIDRLAAYKEARKNEMILKLMMESGDWGDDGTGEETEKAESVDDDDDAENYLEL